MLKEGVHENETLVINSIGFPSMIKEGNGIKENVVRKLATLKCTSASEGGGRQLNIFF